MATVLFRLKHLAVAALGLGIAASAQAQFVTNSRFIPPPNGVYVDELSGNINFVGTNRQLLPGATWFGFSNCILPPTIVTDLTTRTRMTGTLRDTSGAVPIDSFFDVFYEIDMRMQPVTGTNPEVIDIEILQMNLVGGALPPPVMIRESPTRQSTGRTQITPVGGGLYHIDSFFDVFTELSLDGVSNWTPGSRAGGDGNMRMRLQSAPVPEPATLALAGAALAAAVRRRRRSR